MAKQGKVKPGEECGQREEWSELAVVSREQGRLTKDEEEEEGGLLATPLLPPLYLQFCDSLS